MDVAGVQLSCVKTGKGAADEHGIHRFYMTRVELAAEFEIGQRVAIFKHQTHIGHLACIQGTDIYIIQCPAGKEHLRHIGDLAGI